MATVGEQPDGTFRVEKIEAKKPHLSISQLEMMSKCGEQYRRRYILGEKIPPGIALIVGKAVDRTVTANLARKMSGDGLMKIEQVADQARDNLGAEWDNSDVSLNADEMQLGLKAVKAGAVDKTIRLSKLHAKEKAPRINPTHLQREMMVELEAYPYDLLGYVDIQEGSKAIRDTKTTAKTPPGDKADKEDQLTMYAMMAKVIDGVIPEKLCLDFLIDTATPKALTLESTRDEDDFRPMLRRVETAIVALEKGVFVPARETDWWCNEKWCGYHSTCPFVKKSKRPSA